MPAKSERELFQLGTRKAENQKGLRPKRPLIKKAATLKRLKFHAIKD